MTTFLNLIQHGGAAAVLLYVQLGIVVALGFSLLWLIMRRLREEAAMEATALEDDAWLQQVLAERHDDYDAIIDENRALKEKLRFLEAKVLEFEILNQQMGSLPTLRAENERLREKIQYLEDQAAITRKRPESESA